MNIVVNYDATAPNVTHGNIEQQTQSIVKLFLDSLINNNYD